jgi:hypothetical protein
MKKIILLAFALIALLAFVGCAPKAADTSAAPTATATPAPAAKDPLAGASYVMQFGGNFKPNPADDMGLSVVIVVDVSGSMADPPQSEGDGGTPKYIQATGAIHTVAALLENYAKKHKDQKFQVGIIRFSDHVEEILPVTLLNADGIAQLESIIRPDSFTPGGGTAIGGAMQYASEMLANSGTIEKSIMIVTDGENNIDPDPRKVMAAIHNNWDSALATTDDQLISFVGFDVQSPQFDEFAKLGARISSANNQAEIEKGLKSFLNADIKNLENK